MPCSPHPNAIPTKHLSSIVNLVFIPLDSFYYQATEAAVPAWQPTELMFQTMKLSTRSQHAILYSEVLELLLLVPAKTPFLQLVDWRSLLACKKLCVKKFLFPDWGNRYAKRNWSRVGRCKVQSSGPGSGQVGAEVSCPSVGSSGRQPVPKFPFLEGCEACIGRLAGFSLRVSCDEAEWECISRAAEQRKQNCNGVAFCINRSKSHPVSCRIFLLSR